MAKKRFYAVKFGKKTGIYTEWFGPGGAKVQVDGVSGAIYKGFVYRDEAEQFLAEPIKRLKNQQVKRKPKEFKYAPNKGPKNSNSFELESFYNGDIPPWEFPAFIACIEGKYQDVIDHLDLSESVVCWYQ